MKKIVSIILSIMMVFAVAAMSVVPALADVNSSVPGPISQGEVNGVPSSNVTWIVNPTDPTQFTFTYNGTGELMGWTFPDLVETVDYNVVEQTENSITIKLTESGATQAFAGNAIVKNTDETTTEVSPSKKDDSSKSPSTGATVAGVAVAGAGIAMLAALKKKND